MQQRIQKNVIGAILTTTILLFGLSLIPAHSNELTKTQPSSGQEASSKLRHTAKSIVLTQTQVPKPAGVGELSSKYEVHYPKNGVSFVTDRGTIVSVSVNGPEQKRQNQWMGLVGSRYVVGDVHATDVTPLLWRNLELDIIRPGGLKAFVKTMRPLWWLNKAKVSKKGDVFDIEIVEAGVKGRARIIHFDDCVTVDSRSVKPGSALVIGVIKHENAQALNLYFGGTNSAPFGVTPSHPIFSTTRDQYVPAGKLVLGEKVKTKSGVIELVKIEQRPEALTVHNLGVHRAQHYFAGPDKIKVHNTDFCAPTVDPDDVFDYYALVRVSNTHTSITIKAPSLKNANIASKQHSHLLSIDKGYDSAMDNRKNFATVQWTNALKNLKTKVLRKREGFTPNNISSMREFIVELSAESAQKALIAQSKQLNSKAKGCFKRGSTSCVTHVEDILEAGGVLAKNERFGYIINDNGMHFKHFLSLLEDKNKVNVFMEIKTP